MHRPACRLPAAWALRALLLLCSAPLLAGCESLSRAGDDEEKDNVARADYFESAALTYYDGARYDLAEIQFRKVLELRPDDKKAKRGLAKSLYHQGSYPKLAEARKLLEEVVGEDWPNPGGTGSRRYEVQTDLALVYSDTADLFDRDIRNLETRQRTDPSADEATLQDWVRKQTARRNELLQLATPLYQEVLKASADNPYALAGMAKSHLQLGNDDLGIHYARRYLKLSKDSQDAWRKGLASWEESAGGAGKVTEDQRRDFMRRIQGAREKEMKMHLMLASVHMRRSEFSSAVDSYTEVIGLDSTVPAAYVERAQAFGAMGEYRRAVMDLEEYLKITDPQVHREQRTSAVELMRRYQDAMARRG